MRDMNLMQGLWIQDGSGSMIPVTLADMQTVVSGDFSLWTLNRGKTALQQLSIADIAVCGSGYPSFLGVISFTSGTVSTLIVSSGREIVLESNADCHVTLGASGDIGGTIPALSGIPVTSSMPKAFPIIDFSGWINVTQAAVSGSGQLWIWDNK